MNGEGLDGCVNTSFFLSSSLEMYVPMMAASISMSEVILAHKVCVSVCVCLCVVCCARKACVHVCIQIIIVGMGER